MDSITTHDLRWAEIEEELYRSAERLHKVYTSGPGALQRSKVVAGKRDRLNHLADFVRRFRTGKIQPDTSVRLTDTYPNKE